MAKDHYVPQFYLRNFSPWGKQNQIYLYRRGLAPKLVGISSVACDEDYYEDKVDKTLSNHEKQSASIIKKLLDAQKVDLNEKERKRLSAFVGTLANRTPHSQERLHKQHSFVTGSLEEFFADKEDFFRSQRNLGFTGTDEELESIRLGYLASAKQNYLRHDPRRTDSHLIEAALELAKDTEGVIEKRQWHLLESASSRVFVTSDNPVVLTRPENEELWRAVGLNLGSVLLPVSPKRCLLIDDAKRGNALIPISREMADAINRYVIGYAHQAVFANLSSKTIAAAFDRTQLGEKTDVIAAAFGGKADEPSVGSKQIQLTGIC
jgi:hypothetical protein